MNWKIWNVEEGKNNNGWILGFRILKFRIFISIFRELKEIRVYDNIYDAYDWIADYGREF